MSEPIPTATETATVEPTPTPAPPPLVAPEPPLAERLLHELRRLREHEPAHYPLTLTELVQRVAPTTDPAVLKKALADKKLKPQLLYSVKNKPDAPVALVEDGDRLFASDALLLWAIDFGRGKVWQVKQEKLPAKVVAEGKDRFLQALDLRRQEERWPTGVEVVSADPLVLGLTALKPPPPPPPPVKPHILLAQQLVEQIQSDKAKGDNSYPLSLNELLVRVGTVDAKVLKKALSEASFTTALVRWWPKSLDAPLVLSGDEATLVESTALLSFVVGLVCVKKTLMASSEMLAAALPEAQRPLFSEALHRRLTSQQLPANLGAIRLQDRWFVYSQANPPAPEWLLATEMYAELVRRRDRAPQEYATTLRSLATDHTDDKLLHGALKQPDLANNLLPALKNDLDAPVVLKTDEAVLAAAPALPGYLLSKLRSEATQALPVAELKKKLDAALRGLFEESLQTRLQNGTLPEEIGTLRIKNALYLFLRADVNRVPSAPPSPSVPPVAPPSTPPVPARNDFAAAFEAAFTRRNQARGDVNQVSLVDLRHDLHDFDRAAFDAGLTELRRAGLFTLSQAEGREGISAAEQQAALREDGALLLHVSRRR